MGMDARSRYTQMVIRSSFCEILQEKPFHKITLKEVCERAGINRTTFYKYYKDIYDWKEQLEADCIAQTMHVIENSYENPSIRELLIEQFRGMKRDADLYALISSPNFESNVLEVAVSLTLEAGNLRLEQRHPYKDAVIPSMQWDVYYLVHGVMGVINCWLQNGMKESPEELADYYIQKVEALKGR